MSTDDVNYRVVYYLAESGSREQQAIMLFPTFKKIGVTFNFTKFRGGGEGCRQNLFFRTPILSHLISRFMLFSTLKNIENYPFTYWLNGR